MRVQIGSSHQALPGFTNVDIRPVGENTKRGHAADLSFALDGQITLLFSNALFEHLYLGHQSTALREWRRAVSGTVVCLGIPNFPEVARRYLEGAPGILGDTFDLYHVYRYTHGDPEGETYVDWGRVSPSRTRNVAPDEWLPQLHKGIFDPVTVTTLFTQAGFDPVVFEYAFPGEPYRLNLGVVAGSGLDVGLDAVPGVERWVDRTTILRAPAATGSVLARMAIALADQRHRRRDVARRRLGRSWAFKTMRSRGHRKRHPGA